MTDQPDVEVLLVTGEKLRVAGTVEQIQGIVDAGDSGWAVLELTPLKRKAMVRVEHVCAITEAPRRIPSR
jgi:hypothetical protein